MWTQYKKTFGRIQPVIALVTYAAFAGLQRQWSVALGFFIVMQVGAVLGAAWGHRLGSRKGAGAPVRCVHPTRLIEGGR